MSTLSDSLYTVRNTQRHLTAAINCALRDSRIRRRAGGAQTLSELLERWEDEGRTLRWQAEEIGQLTTGSAAYPGGIWPTFRTVGNWQRKRRPVAA